ncbi:hypothetical protein [Mucilaginibacter lappiensis]|uniref:Uncharacterized protein n=1 Tax=Mucilaginibacter lappiensis TaxID=354630 RepID=A0A1N7GEG3_9SPHI|nr:hypothetical protein [Mucilaginibacter lappiensis]MBB6113046.1 hypothetical protein [Mucilaginibacter lappiensis]MBB6130700.1 hypothetical protein [Mucilaginibacter lappiensis]SIS11005.1 hypothetical protein SAMN05421821_12720 [Mucilaginibacter lappiensis]
METAINVKSPWNTAVNPPKYKKSSIYERWLALEDSQAENKTMWYLISMVAQGVFFLPIPAYLIYYYNASSLVLIITMVFFFANIIAGMGGYGIRVLMSIFAFSVFAHVLMLAFYLL